MTRTWQPEQLPQAHLWRKCPIRRSACASNQHQGIGANQSPI